MKTLTKKLWLTILTFMLALCTVFSLILTTPLITKADATTEVPDFTTWSEKTLEVGDVVAEKYIKVSNLETLVNDVSLVLPNIDIYIYDNNLVWLNTPDEGEDEDYLPVVATYEDSFVFYVELFSQTWFDFLEDGDLVLSISAGDTLQTPAGDESYPEGFLEHFAILEEPSIGEDVTPEEDTSNDTTDDSKKTVQTIADGIICLKYGYFNIDRIDDTNSEGVLYGGTLGFRYIIPDLYFNSNYEYGFFYTAYNSIIENNIKSNYAEKAEELGFSYAFFSDTLIDSERGYQETFNHIRLSKTHLNDVIFCVYYVKDTTTNEIAYSAPLFASYNGIMEEQATLSNNPNATPNDPTEDKTVNNNENTNSTNALDKTFSLKDIISIVLIVCLISVVFYIIFPKRRRK